MEEECSSSPESYTEGLMAPLFSKPTEHYPASSWTDETVEVSYPVGASEVHVRAEEAVPPSDMRERWVHIYPQVTGSLTPR